MNISQALEELRAASPDSPDVAYLVEFIEKSSRGIIR
jgi:acyl-[acyl carrier protein]--UDP-N-acetylglucosamine O-acyltransferase